MARVGRPPSCECGECVKCQRRTEAREAYQALSVEERRARIAARDKEKVRAADRARHERHRQARNERVREYLRTPSGKLAHKKAVARYNGANPEKQHARTVLNNAVRDGKLVRGLCERAGESCAGAVHGHHDDYSQPLKVRWLCDKHHKDVHVELDQLAVAA
jgi:hypothetical protein